MTLKEINHRLSEISERLDVIEEVRLLVAEKAQLEAEISAERSPPELKRLLAWVDADVGPLLRRAEASLRGPAKS